MLRAEQDQNIIQWLFKAIGIWWVRLILPSCGFAITFWLS